MSCCRSNHDHRHHPNVVLFVFVTLFLYTVVDGLHPALHHRQQPTQRGVSSEHQHHSDPTTTRRYQVASRSRTSGSFATFDDTPSTGASAVTTGGSGVEIIPPGASFRDTKVGKEVSVVSLNLLASYYHLLGANETEGSTKLQREQEDRLRRTPLSIALAKQTNADILLLQEVEGQEHEHLLQKCLATRSTQKPEKYSLGYDSYVWSALYPHRTDNIDPVGLAVAWRSSRYRLVSCESFRRGMLVQLQEMDSNATLILANLHLFAKPSAVTGRLKTMASAIQRIQELEQQHHLPSSSSSSPLDGTIVVAGDFNCDHPSVTTRLLTTGSIPFGKVKDRNYQAKITKSDASRMKQPFPFQHIYHQEENMHRMVAPVTVSLKGRGPGCMDHMFYVSGNTAKAIQRGGKQKLTRNNRFQTKLSAGALYDLLNSGKRSTRRTRAQQRSKLVTPRRHDHLKDSRPVSVRAVLSTTDATNSTRTKIIMNGLPNESEGFPSDHLPIGAMFGPDPTYATALYDDDTSIQRTMSSHSSNINNANASSNTDNSRHKQQHLSVHAQRRRQTHVISTRIRRRHNTILRVIADWLVQQGGATDMIRDQPLYKWKYTAGLHGLRKKMRAPDLCCILSNCSNKKTLVIVEVSVGSRPADIRVEKLKKYRDLTALLQTSQCVVDANLTVAENVFALVFDEDGQKGIPSETRTDLQKLLLLATGNSTHKNDEATSLHHLEEQISEILMDFGQNEGF